MVTIRYQDEGEIEEEDLGLSLLDISLKHGIAHSHVCGRAARCTTCRVQVLGHPENLLPPTEEEKAFAANNGLAQDVRLACRTYLRGPVTLRRPIREQTDVDTVAQDSFRFAGSVQNLGVLFCDIRDFTGLSERLAPYDLFHLLDRYYGELGEVVLQHHGYLHQYYGDGLLALFGFYARGAAQVCLDAVTASLEMIEALERFNRYARNFFEEGFRIGIGLHYGEVLAGKIGHPRSKQLTVIEDVVNMANRIENTSKTTGSPLVVSEVVYWHLGATVIKARPFLASLRGKSGRHRLYEVLGYAPGFDRDQALTNLRRQA
jgi:adenylate cyclase